MSRALEERILGAITMVALESGWDLSMDAVGQEILLKLPDATLWLRSGAGAELIQDCAGNDATYAPLLEAAQNVCEEFWKDERE